MEKTNLKDINFSKRNKAFWKMTGIKELYNDFTKEEKDSGCGLKAKLKIEKLKELL